MMIIVEEIRISIGNVQPTTRIKTRQNTRNKSSSYENTGYNKSNYGEAESNFDLSFYGPQRNKKNNTTVDAQLE